MGKYRLPLFIIAIALLSACAAPAALPEAAAPAHAGRTFPPRPTGLLSPAPASPPNKLFTSQETATIFPMLTKENQMKCFTMEQLSGQIQNRESLGLSDEDVQAIEAHMRSRFREAEITLPDDAVIGHSAGAEDMLISTGETKGYCALTSLISPSAAQEGEHTNTGAVAACVELVDGMVTANDGTALAQYVSRAWLVPATPGKTDLFSVDGQCHVSFFQYDGNAVIYTDCYALTPQGGEFDIKEVTQEEHLAAWQRHRRVTWERNMRQSIAEGAEYGFSVEQLQYLYESLNRKGRIVDSKLYGGVSYTQSAGLTIQYAYNEQSGDSTWNLQLTWPEGKDAKTSLTANSYSEFETGYAAVDLTGDNKEEIILHITPINSNTRMDGQLHVFCENDGVFEEILTLYGNEPARSSFVIPEHFRALTPDADINGLAGCFQSVETITFGGVGILRLGTYIGQNTYFTYLWYNHNGQWEVVDQTAQ